jgi:predicted unusual protein kinase regulating ubiquinone biosynthesis (AarF/ABC1/UbiB family)
LREYCVSGGNLLKVKCDEEGLESGHNLAYLDFGLLATVPTTVRDALVCAVAQLVFARDVNAVADLFGELDLLPPDVLEDPIERAALGEALTLTLNEALIYPTNKKDVGMNSDTISTTVPVLRFDKVLNGLTQLVPRFRFRLPPYFLNNARALGTLEGTARQLDPDFNVLQILYPYAIHRIIQNPTKSAVVDVTLQSLMRRDGRLELGKISQLLEDSAALTAFTKRRVLWDILKTKEGRTLARSITKEGFATGIFKRKRIASNQGKRKIKRRSFLSRDYLKL